MKPSKASRLTWPCSEAPSYWCATSAWAEQTDVDETISPVLAKDGSVEIEPIPAPDKNIWLNFRISCMVGSYRAEASGKPIALSFCDYASAGNTYTEASYFRTWFPQLLDPSKKGTAE